MLARNQGGEPYSLLRTHIPHARNFSCAAKIPRKKKSSSELFTRFNLFMAANSDFDSRQCTWSGEKLVSHQSTSLTWPRHGPVLQRKVCERWLWEDSAGNLWRWGSREWYGRSHHLNFSALIYLAGAYCWTGHKAMCCPDPSPYENCTFIS